MVFNSAFSITRELLRSWVYFVDDFNDKETTGISNIRMPCLTKVGQNCFFDDKKPFMAWLNSLNTNALYKALMEAHTALKLL